MTTFVESIYGTSDTLADRVRAVARGTVVLDVVKALQDEARTSLREAVDQESARTGTAFTARLDGVTALVTDPQPRPRVTDEAAFAAWFGEAYGEDVQRVQRVEVIDQARAVHALVYIGQGDPDECVAELEASLKLVDETVLPAKALDLAVDRARIHVTGDACIDVMTGEHVPGTTVTTGQPVLQVKLDRAARARATAEVRAVLGLSGELGGAA